MCSVKDPSLNVQIWSILIPLWNTHCAQGSQLHSKAISTLLLFPHQSRTAPPLLYFVSWEGPCYFIIALGKPIEYLWWKEPPIAEPLFHEQCYPAAQLQSLAGSWTGFSMLFHLIFSVSFQLEAQLSRLNHPPVWHTPAWLNLIDLHSWILQQRSQIWDVHIENSLLIFPPSTPPPTKEKTQTQTCVFPRGAFFLRYLLSTMSWWEFSGNSQRESFEKLDCCWYLMSYTQHIAAIEDRNV